MLGANRPIGAEPRRYPVRFPLPTSQDLLYSPRDCEPWQNSFLFAGVGAPVRGERGNLKNIFVGNLSFNTVEDELRQLFQTYGQVDRVSILTDRETGRSRGFAFVEMANAEEGEKAIAALNGTDVGGRTINVNEARPKAERPGGGGGGGGRGGDRGDRGDRGHGRR
jgi:cold-inducible RNA-binding protein